MALQQRQCPRTCRCMSLAWAHQALRKWCDKCTQAIKLQISSTTPLTTACGMLLWALVWQVATTTSDQGVVVPYPNRVELGQHPAVAFLPPRETPPPPVPRALGGNSSTERHYIVQRHLMTAVSSPHQSSQTRHPIAAKLASSPARL